MALAVRSSIRLLVAMEGEEGQHWALSLAQSARGRRTSRSFSRRGVSCHTRDIILTDIGARFSQRCGARTWRREDPARGALCGELLLALRLEFIPAGWWPGAPSGLGLLGRRVDGWE